jgi:Tol biopolymer transport system component
MKHRTLLAGMLLSLTFIFSSHAQQNDFPVLKGPYLGQKPPGELPELFMPGIISNCDLHSSVYFSPDGKEVYFSKLKESNIWYIVFMREKNGQWTQPQSLCKGLTPFLSPDGKTLLFSTQDWDLWKMEKSTAGWSEPINLGTVINFARRQDGPSVTRDGTLYYCTAYQNAKGIVRSTFKDGCYTEPQALESAVNSNHNEGFPFIAPDESYIIFSSFRHGSYGQGDLYISFRNNNGTWTEARNLGPKINSEAKDRFPCVSPDGKYLFFNSNRVSGLNAKPIADGPGNIYWVDAKIIEELTPKEFRREP